MSNLDVFLENNKWLETLPNKESNEVTEEIRKNNNIVCKRKDNVCWIFLEKSGQAKIFCL